MLKVFAFSVFLGAAAIAAPDPRVKEAVIVVDKKNNKLHVTDYNDGRLRVIQTFRTTLGQNVGDKLMEGDLKTPEGIYEFLFRQAPPALKPKFGPLAIYVGYPNSMDKTGRKTGYDIMIHGTDDPARLEKNFDSLGCVVLDNVNVAQVSDYVKLKETKVIISRDYEALSRFERLDKAKAFLQNWLKVWSNKDLVGYIESYADEFRNDGMDRIQYAKYKDSLNKKYDTISVTAENARFYFHEKYDIVTFDQIYKSTFKGGVPAYVGSSKKQLFLQERNGHYRIVLEENKK